MRTDRTMDAIDYVEHEVLTRFAMAAIPGTGPAVSRLLRDMDVTNLEERTACRQHCAFQPYIQQIAVAPEKQPPGAQHILGDHTWASPPLDFKKGVPHTSDVANMLAEAALHVWAFGTEQDQAGFFELPPWWPAFVRAFIACLSSWEEANVEDGNKLSSGVLEETDRTNAQLPK
jgi:hypothetical protein